MWWKPKRVWYKDGQETRRELLHTSNYRAYQQVIEYITELEEIKAAPGIPGAVGC